MPIRTPALKVVQNRRTLYVTALRVRDLEKCSIDHWQANKRGKWKGYQRDLIPKKVNSIAKYLERADAIMPTAGLLNVRQRGSLQFSNRSKSLPAVGTLTIPDYVELWIVDMQHRSEGLKKALENGHFNTSVPVVICEGLDRVDEAAQFYLINTTSKRMSVDLTRRILIEHNRIRDLAGFPKWQLKAVQITIRLGRDRFDGNPWRGRIRPPNSEKLRLHVATEKSFVPSLRWLLAAPETSTKSAKSLARFLAMYWESICTAVPEAFEDPKDHLIQKTPGYLAFHYLAPLVYREVSHLRAASAKRKLARMMEPLARRGSRFWSTQNRQGARRFGPGGSGSLNLAMFLQKELGLTQD